jgi:hypothetical protein
MHLIHITRVAYGRAGAERGVPSSSVQGAGGGESPDAAVVDRVVAEVLKRLGKG